MGRICIPTATPTHAERTISACEGATRRGTSVLGLLLGKIAVPCHQKCPLALLAERAWKSYQAAQSVIAEYTKQHTAVGRAGACEIRP